MHRDAYDMTEVRCWRDQAACLEVVSADYDPFFADSAELQAEAIAICAACPVQDACLTFAVRTGQQYGIWGGQPQQIVRRLIVPVASGPRTPGQQTHCKGPRFTPENTYYARQALPHCLRGPTHRARRRRRGGNADVA